MHKNKNFLSRKLSELHLRPSLTPQMDLFVKIVNGFELLTVFAKSSSLDVGSEYVCFWKLAAKLGLSQSRIFSYQTKVTLQMIGRKFYSFTAQW